MVDLSLGGNWTGNSSTWLLQISFCRGDGSPLILVIVWSYFLDVTLLKLLLSALDVQRGHLSLVNCNFIFFQSQKTLRIKHFSISQSILPILKFQSTQVNLYHAKDSKWPLWKLISFSWGPPSRCEVVSGVLDVLNPQKLHFCFFSSIR